MARRSGRGRRARSCSLRRVLEMAAFPATYRLRLGKNLTFAVAAGGARPVPARPRRLPPLPLAIVPRRAPARGTARRRRPRRVLGRARRRGGLPRARRGGAQGGARDRARHRPEPHGRGRREPVLGGSGAPAANLRPRRGDGAPPALLRDRPPRRRAPGGPEVFAETHRLALRSCAEGSSTGCGSTTRTASPTRPDTSSALRDGAPRTVGGEDPRPRRAPARHGRSRARSATSSSSTSRRCSSTRPARSALTALWEELAATRARSARGQPRPSASRSNGPFAPDVEWLRRLHPAPGLEEALAALPVYRTYAAAVEPAAEEDLEVLREAGLEGFLDGAPEAFVTRFQQTTPPVMAKGVDDTAFYRYVRLLALNDVGGDPGRFGIAVDGFHARERRARRARAAQPARLLHARHEALGRRAGAARRRWPGSPRVGAPRCAAGARRARRCGPPAGPTRSRSTRSSRRWRAHGRSSPSAWSRTWRRRCASARWRRTGSSRTRRTRPRCSATAARCTSSGRSSTTSSRWPPRSPPRATTPRCARRR